MRRRLALTALFVPAALVAGCASLPAPEAVGQRLGLHGTPALRLVPERGLDAPTGAAPLVYDAFLPGYRAAQPIATVRVERTEQPLPERFVVHLAPSTGTPMLERVAVRGYDGTEVATALGAAVETVTPPGGPARSVAAGTHFDVRAEGAAVRVTLRRPALALLARGGTLDWVDAYRR